MRAHVFTEKAYDVNPDYTSADLKKIELVALAARQHLAQQGIDIKFTKHFFDRIPAMRGIGKIDHMMVMETLAKIANRGLAFFNNKPELTSYAFADQKNFIIMEVLKVADSEFLFRTVIRSDRWLGTSQKIKL